MSDRANPEQERDRHEEDRKTGTGAAASSDKPFMRQGGESPFPLSRSEVIRQHVKDVLLKLNEKVQQEHSATGEARQRVERLSREKKGNESTA